MVTATALQADLRNKPFHTLLELAPAIEDGFGARYSDPANYGDIVLYKLTNRYGDYYACWWGDDPEEMRQWSRLEHHFDRLSYRLNGGWELVSRDAVEALKAKAAEGIA